MENIKSLKKTIFFGHQSVGANLLNGIHKISPQSMENITESYIGENRDPLSKIIDFEKNLKNINNVDIAMMKFCFVDIPNQHTPEQILEYYDAMIQRIQHQYPNIKIIHITVPLTSNPTGLINQTKTIIKKLIGKPTYNPILNKDRNEFNKLIKQKYSKDDIFDLAFIESNGERYQENGFPALFPGYTYDGGHLNEDGSRIIGKEFLNFLTNL